MLATALIALNFLKPADHLVSAKQKTVIKEWTKNHNLGGINVSSNIEDFLIKLNTAKSYDEIPERITVCYGELIRRNIDFKDTYDIIKLTTKLAANKFNEKHKEIIITGYASQDINLSDSEKLTSAGFIGCGLSPRIYGIEAADESMRCLKKDPSYWSRVATPNKIITNSKTSPLEITLTFRQEQIFNMVCKGMTNYQIAKRLDLSESTVKMHIGIVLKKYKVQHRSQLIASTK